MGKTQKYIKWPGSKYAAASVVGPVVAAQLQGRDRLVVPFAGSLALTQWLAERGHLDSVKVYVNDYNQHLINAWRAVFDRDRAKKVLGILKLQSKLWVRKHEKGEWVDEVNTKTGKSRRVYKAPECEAMFDRIKTQLNSDLSNDPVYSAALFLFFNRTCFNGLWRESKKTGLNVPIGRTSKRDYMNIPDWEAVLEAGSWVRDLDIVFAHGDFHKFLRYDFYEAGLAQDLDDTVVYADPPYHNKFVQYNANGFSEDRESELASELTLFARNQAICVMSNSAEFADKLDFQWVKTLFSSKTSVSCAADKGQMDEMVAVLKGI